jgi:hypothetical protein
LLIKLHGVQSADKPHCCSQLQLLYMSSDMTNNLDSKNKLNVIY